MGNKEEAFKNKINRLYVEFFGKHGFKEKSVYISRFLSKDKCMSWSPALYLGWLAEWSKKIYCQLLQD